MVEVSKKDVIIAISIIVILVLVSIYNIYDTFRFQDKQKRTLGYIQFSNKCFIDEVNKAINESRSLERDNMCDCVKKQEDYLNSDAYLNKSFSEELSKSYKEYCMVKLIF